MAAGSVYGGRFCNSDENQITTIGTGYVANFISGGGATRGGATLTDKRVYFSGQTFSRESKGLTMTKEQKIVNVRDVTGVGYTYFQPLYFLIRAAIAGVVSVVGFVQEIETSDWGTRYDPVWIAPAVIAVVIALAYIIAYFLKRRTLFSIEYAGGVIAFDTRWFWQEELDVFIRNIHLAKDKLYSRAAAEQGFVSGDYTEEDGVFITDDLGGWNCEYCGNANSQLEERCKYCGR